MEITVREYCKMDAAAELMHDLLLDEKTSKTGMQAVLGMILDELKSIRMREADRMNEWGPGELEDQLTEDYRGVLDLAKRLGPKKPAGDRLPDVPDWRDGAAQKTRTGGHCGHCGRCGQGAGSEAKARDAGTDGAAQFAEEDELVRIRLTVAAHEGESLRKIIDAIKAEDGIKPAELAGLLGVNQARISEALRGHARMGFGARSGGPGGRSGHGGQGAGTGVAANSRGKRGAR